MFTMALFRLFTYTGLVARSLTFVRLNLGFNARWILLQTVPFRPARRPGEDTGSTSEHLLNFNHKKRPIVVPGGRIVYYPSDIPLKMGRVELRLLRLPRKPGRTQLIRGSNATQL
jgi:hypothetical protein